MNERPRLLPLLSVGVVAAALDLASKQWVFSSLGEGESRKVIPGVFELVRHFNPAGPWSWGLGLPRDALRFLLPLLSLLAVAVIVAYLLRTDPRDRVKSLGFVLILGGAVGNLFDRAAAAFDPSWGGVRDFLYFPRIVFGRPFPAFNLADTWITVGVALVAWRILVEGRRTRPGAGEAPA